MNENEIAILVKARDEASKVLGDVEQKAKGIGGALGDTAKIAGGFVLGEGLTRAPGFLLDAAQAAADDAANVAKLKQAVENSGAAWSDYSDQLGQVIEDGQRKAYTDDQVRNSLALLVAQTGNAGEAQKRFALAMDLSRGAGIDLETASKLLGKVTEENVNVLGRYGIKVKEGASETELFGAIQQKFGGQAEAFAQSTAGQMESAKIGMSELKESIGAALIPVMVQLTAVLLPMIGFLSQHKEITTALAIVIGGVLVAAFVAWAVAAAAAAAATIVAMAPVLAIIAGVGLLVAAIVLLVTHWDQVTGAVGRFIEQHKVLAAIIAAPIAPIIALVAAVVLLIQHWDDVVAAAARVQDLVVAAWDTMRDLVSAATQALSDTVSGIWNALSDALGAIVGAIVATVTGLWQSLSDAVAAVVGALAAGVTAAFEALRDGVIGAVQVIHDTVSAVVSAVAQLTIERFQQMTDLAGRATDSLRISVGSAFGAMSSAIESAVGLIEGLMDRLKSAISSALGPLGSILGALDSVISKAASAISAIAGAASSVIPGHAEGTRNYPGGWSWVGERGPELMYVPRGSDIYSNSDSRQMVGGGGQTVIDLRGSYFLGSPEEIKQTMRDVIEEHNGNQRRAAQLAGVI